MSRATAITEVFRSALVALDTLDPDEQESTIDTLLTLLTERRGAGSNPLKDGIKATKHSRVGR